MKALIGVGILFVLIAGCALAPFDEMLERTAGAATQALMLEKPIASSILT